MSDLINNPVFQVNAATGLRQDANFKPTGPEPQQVSAVDPLQKVIDKARESVISSGASGSETDAGRQGREERLVYTILICNCSGESRAVSIKANSSEAAKNAAKAALDEGEEVTSVSESTVAEAPDPNRGLIA
jgi:hypothetical protein